MKVNNSVILTNQKGETNSISNKNDVSKYVSHRIHKIDLDDSFSNQTASPSQILNSSLKISNQTNSKLQKKDSLSDLKRKIQKLQTDLNGKFSNQLSLTKQNESFKAEIARLKKALEASQNTKPEYSNKLRKELPEHSFVNKKSSEAKQQELSVNEVKLKLKEELMRSQDVYSICRKYISIIKGCHKMQKDFVDISDFINNAQMDTQEDLEKLENYQFFSAQNNNIVRELSEPNASVLPLPVEDSPSAQVSHRDKYIQKLEHKLKIREESKKRASSKDRRTAGTATLKRKHKKAKQELSVVRNLPMRNSLIPCIDLSQVKMNRNSSITKRTTMDPRLLDLDTEEPDPEPSFICDVEGLVSYRTNE